MTKLSDIINPNRIDSDFTSPQDHSPDRDLPVKLNNNITDVDLSSVTNAVIREIQNLLIDYDTPEAEAINQDAKILHMQLLHLMALWARADTPSRIMSLLRVSNKFLMERRKLLCKKYGADVKKDTGGFVYPLD